MIVSSKSFSIPDHARGKVYIPFSDKVLCFVLIFVFLSDFVFYSLLLLLLLLLLWSGDFMLSSFHKDLGQKFLQAAQKEKEQSVIRVCVIRKPLIFHVVF